ncbi:zinc finger and SCAN domain-containing protein 12 [Episyrphus balteatus]|uniref:zinc finger and SCAN domain-containing protein 12 n=1 Tax=Episyrphus balteatus TaxID=286459 RepID=UPI0024853336|nr:zinc finger and SCAN domain-containing protein 12 [Episyrphus balteatus]
MAKPKTSTQSTDPNLATICRLCLQYDTGTINIFQSQLSIPVRIMSCSAVEVRSGDGLPELICSKCRYQLEISYYFRHKCQISNRKLKKHIRLLNLGKKSRVFTNSENDDDDDDEEEQQYEESLKFIEAEDARKKSEQDEANQKWLEEQREQFRKEDTLRLFEEFGTFMQSRAPVAIANVKKENNPVSLPTKTEKNDPPPQKKEQLVFPLQKRTVPTPPKQQQQQVQLEDPQPLEIDADNEITSSEQIPDESEQEQAIFYSDNDDGEDESSEMLIFDEKCNEEDNRHHNQHQETVQIDESSVEAEMVEDMSPEEDGGAVEDVIDGNEMENKDNDAEEMSEFIFLADLEDSSHCVERQGRASEVESYQIEENGEIQYLKDERLSHDDEINSNQIDDNYDSKYIMEDVTVVNVGKYGEIVPVKLEKKKKLKKKTPPLRSEIVDLMNARVSTSDLKIFKCSECPQSFTRANSLIRHRSAHRAGREYCCDYCDKFFSCKSSLDRHIRIHTGEKPFTCEQCGKNFMQKEILKRHLTIHTGQRPHQCPHCPRSFVQKLLMKTHINAVHMEVPKIVKNVCHLCPKSFLHPSGLSRHLLTHKGMIFSCAECGRTFNDKSSLRRHFAVHSKSGSKTDQKAEPGENESSNEY